MDWRRVVMRISLTALFLGAAVAFMLHGWTGCGITCVVFACICSVNG